ncbi:hypothetical protein [Geoalkalibacter halelectricus]
MTGGNMELTLLGMSLLALLSVGVAFAYRWADKHQKTKARNEK